MMKIHKTKNEIDETLMKLTCEIAAAAAVNANARQERHRNLFATDCRIQQRENPIKKSQLDTKKTKSTESVETYRPRLGGLKMKMKNIKNTDTYRIQKRNRKSYSGHALER
jgi:hypothetical protein